MQNLGVNFTAWPEMIAWPYLILEGWLPYKDIAIAHNPLLLLDLVIFYKLFGVGILQLKIYTWLLILLNVCLVYFVVNNFWSKKIALLSSVFYLLFTVIFEGNGLWFDLALTPFAILVYYALQKKNYLWVGIFFVLGFLTKQTFVYFALPMILILLKDKLKLVKNIKKLVVGGLVVVTPFLAVLYLLGILDDYYKWAVEFGVFYLPSIEGQIQPPSLNQLLFTMIPFIPLFITKDIYLLIFAIAGAFGVYPRWELFHFQPSLPFLAIGLSVLFFNAKFKKIFKYLLSILLVLFILVGLKRQIGVNTRFYESDVVNTTQRINELKLGNKSLYVVNYWDNLYALTNTLPPKPLIPYIPWYLSYKDNLNLILNGLKIEAPEVVVIGKREKTNSNLYDFIDKYYSCTYVEKEVELCRKNSI